MRSLFLVGGGILIGVGLSYADATVRAEKRLRDTEAQKWKEWVEALPKIDYDIETPLETEEELTFNAEGSVLETPVAPPEYVQEYVERAGVYGDAAHFVEETKLEIITDEDYHEEDGRAKELIQIFMGEGDPYFMQDGAMIDDWGEKIGENILVMFYQNFSPDAKDRVVYIRNNQRGEDYEITQEMVP